MWHLGAQLVGPDHPRPSLEKSQYTIFCTPEDSGYPFPIDIDESKSVGVLKQAIKKVNENWLRDYDAAQLMLYRIHQQGNEEVLHPMH